MPSSQSKSTTSRRGRSFRVAVFGKHPAWDDHIDDIGMTSDRLVWVRRVLYTEGIAGNIDSGAWEKLEGDQRSPGYRQVFYWRTPEGLVVGRMWSSRDGKGRDKYPMVACVHMDGWDAHSPTNWALTEVLPRLDHLQSQCESAQSQSAVRLATETIQHELDRAAEAAPASEEAGSALAKLLDHPDLGNLRIGLMRVLYEAERELGAYKPSGFGVAALKTKVTPSTPRAQHLRVPRCGSRPGEGAIGWMELLGREIGERPFVLLFEPQGERFTDVIVGEPDAASLFCVRATEKGLPLTSDVPYSLSEEFLAAASRKIDSWRSGTPAAGLKAATADAAHAATHTTDQSSRASFQPSVTATSPVAVTTSSKPRIGMIVLAAVVLALAVGAFFVFFGKKGGPPDEANAVPPVVPKSNEVKTEHPRTPPPGIHSGSSRDHDTSSSPHASTVSDSVKTGNADSVAESPRQPRVQEPVQTPVVTALSPSRFESGDPRSNWSVPSDYESARTILERLSADLAADKQPAPSELVASLAKARERIESVSAMKFTAANMDSIVRNMASAGELMGEARREIEAASARDGAKWTDYLASASSRDVSRVPAVNEAWRNAIKRIDTTKGRAAAVARVAAIEEAFKQSEAGFAPAASGTALPLDGFDAGMITHAVKTKREVALGIAARGILNPDPEAIRAAYASAGSSFEKWFADAKSLLDSAAVARQRLKSGYAFDEPGPDGVSISRLLSNCEASLAYSDLASAVSPVLNDARVLAQLPETDDPLRLVAYMKQRRETGPLSHMLAAWRRLSQLSWPGRAEELVEAGELRAIVSSHAGRSDDALRRESTAREAASISRAIWTRFANSHATDSGMLKASINAMPAMGLTHADLALLPDWLRYNFAKAKLTGEIEAMESLRPKEQAAARTAAIADFRRSLDELGPGVSGRPEVSSLLKALDSAAGDAADVDVSKFGPGRAGWKASQVADDGSTVSFTAAIGGKTHTLRFRRVMTDDAESASYVGTTEVSVSLFVAMIASANKWDEAKPLLRSFDPRTDDPRDGPRVWTWSGRPSEPIITNRALDTDTSNGWLKRVNLSGGSYYPAKLWPEGGPAAPSMEHPMQQVSFRAAVLAAKAAGCRLPTSREWQAAAAMESYGNNNVRDNRWRQQYEHVRANVKTAAPEFPSAGCFWPRGVSRIAPPNDSEVVSSADDGWLWFAPVTEGGGATFSHIRGNVAEFVYESPGDIERADATRAGITAALGRGEQVRVIGGSALMSPRVKADEAQPVEFGQALEGWSDVGLRLAFSTPMGAATGTAGVERLKQALAASPLLKEAGYK